MNTPGDEEKINHGVLLGAWVRERRLALRLTQEQVADRMGGDIPDNFVTKLENGAWKGLIPQPRLGQLARALGVPEVDILRGAGVITEAPATPSSDPYPRGDPRRIISDNLPELRDDDAEFVRIVVEAAVERRRSIGAEEIVTEAREAAEAGAVGMAHRQMRRLPVEADEDEPVPTLV